MAIEFLMLCDFGPIGTNEIGVYSSPQRVPTPEPLPTITEAFRVLMLDYDRRYASVPEQRRRKGKGERKRNRANRYR